MADKYKTMEAAIQDLAGVHVEDDFMSDNLAIVLCSYFSRHINRPDDDEETDDNWGWGDWVVEKSNEALRRIATDLVLVQEQEPEG